MKPAYWEYKFFLNEFMICCCKRKSYKKYMKTLEKAATDVDRTMDLVRFLRRVRMHGIILTILAPKPVR